MKIGFSLGRCVRDIVKGDVSIDDVAFIIAATAIREKEKLRPVIQDYTWRDGYLNGLDEEVCQSVAEQLWDQRKILQPRLQGLQRHMQPENAVWVDMFPTGLSENDAVKKSWDSYRFMLHMTENIDTEALETFK